VAGCKTLRITNAHTIKIDINTAAEESHIQRGAVRLNCHAADLAAGAPGKSGGLSAVDRAGPAQAWRACSRSPIGARALGKSRRPDGLAQTGPAAGEAADWICRAGAVGALERRSGFSTLAGSRPGHAGRDGRRSLAGVRGGAVLMLSSGFPAVAGSGLGHPGRAGAAVTRREAVGRTHDALVRSRQPLLVEQKLLVRRLATDIAVRPEKEAAHALPPMEGLTSKNTWDGLEK